MYGQEVRYFVFKEVCLKYRLDVRKRRRIKCFTVRELKATGRKTEHIQEGNVVTLSVRFEFIFRVFPLVALKPRFFKMVLPVQRSTCVLFHHKSKPEIKVKSRFNPSKPSLKCPSTSSTVC
jgi:hypothetical protein